MTLEDLVRRADELLELARKALASVRQTSAGPLVQSELFANLRSSSLSFIEQTFGREHTYYREFDRQVSDVTNYHTERAIGILNAVRAEIAGGWIMTTRGLVSAEVFADFLEMAEHLLSENYKDSPAVMTGSVLEEHLRQLAGKYNVPVDEVKAGRMVPRKADIINADLQKAGAYNKLDQKSVTGWLDLRNKAAHGRYAEYAKGQVELLLAAVRDFIARHPI